MERVETGVTSSLGGWGLLKAHLGTSCAILPQTSQKCCSISLFYMRRLGGSECPVQGQAARQPQSQNQIPCLWSLTVPVFRCNPRLTEGQGSATQKFVLFGSVSAAIGTGLAHSRAALDTGGIKGALGGSHLLASSPPCQVNGWRTGLMSGGES